MPLIPASFPSPGTTMFVMRPIVATVNEPSWLTVVMSGPTSRVRIDVSLAGFEKVSVNENVAISTVRFPISSKKSWMVTNHWEAIG